ncbi:MAG: hypothetical protein A3F68_00570 [Acidobacteria bacterium RIFCSPLOWO2_12_FULL_54_10]|nr:MAG: hypothetical protein A3F68_00570 [Acidobacteria bacterium RIFCSPLOWO2_12_FULL_54_10]
MSDLGKLYGQWIGQIAGTNSGYACLNVDSDRPEIGYFQVADVLLPHSVQAVFTINESEVSGTLSNFLPLGPAISSDVQLPTQGSFSGSLSEEQFNGKWETDGGTNGTFKLDHINSPSSQPCDELMSWGKFREWILNEFREKPSLIFRGHHKSVYPLLTSFHRTGRRNIYRYASEDVPELCRSIEAILGTRYDIDNPVDHGALLNLGQHHGFPTPLLDWTESPFVAAFFAFSPLPKVVSSEADTVRIFIFDCVGWPDQQIETILHIRPCFAHLRLRARDNVRVIPQQSVHMYSNHVAIEEYVKWVETKQKRQFLRRIDIPASDRLIAMRDLVAMGVTASSLFPGLDGLCRSLTEKWF